MALHARALIRSVFDGKRDVAKLVTGGAWLFALGSLFPLFWIVADGGADGAVFRANVEGGTFTVPLLTYSGGVGLLLIWAEIFAITGAFILAAAPRVPLKLARIGHGVLIAWSLLWTLGTWRLALVGPGFWTFQALFLSVLCGCTLWRAWVNWRPTTSTSAEDGETTPGAHSSNYFADAPSQHPPEPPDSDSTREQIVHAIDQARVAAIAASRKIIAGVKAGVAAARNHDAKT